ncbi:MAG: hypothetical protein INR73_27970 [Williamsia sp.]|nr:hypothetical protein [Williamsia sp.]
MKQVYRRVVLVDSEAIQIKIHKLLVRRYFGRHSIEVLSFTDPIQALLYLEEENDNKICTLVLLAMHMPYLNGLEFLDNLKFVSANTNIVYLVSASCIQTGSETAYKHPRAAGYLVQPIDLMMERLFADTLSATKNGNDQQTE